MSAQKLSRILLYAGEGVAERSLRDTPIALRQVLGETFELRAVTAQDLHSGTVLRDAQLFIMPGGADVPYVRAMRGAGNRHLRAWVMGGGAYIGFCAGAYYGCSRIEFDKGYPLEVCGERELGFFAGVAKGPAFGNGTFRYENESGMAAARISYQHTAEKKEALLYYNGGCFFEAESSAHVHAPQYRAIAYYEDLEGRVAAVQCKVGAGLAVLCGLHPEYLSAPYTNGSEFVQGAYRALRERDESRKEFLRFILEQAGIVLD